MAVTNPFSITYGALAVGGSSQTLLLHGPYVIDRSSAKLRLVFEVVVVATSYATLNSLSASVESAFSARDVNLVINLGGSTTTYTSGSNILNVVGSCAKSGNSDSDRGYSRAYSVIIEGDLPADDQEGIRQFETSIDYSPSRQRTVSMRGLYTAVADVGSASAAYAADIDETAAAILSSIDSGASWELVHEEENRDRNDHSMQFMRQYVELLDEQVAGTLDDPRIRDHRVSFTDLSQHPGDSTPGIYRLRRVVANYDCAVDIDNATDPKAVFADAVMPHLIALFQANFHPQVFGVEDYRVGVSRTSSRISAAVTFVYQRAEGQATVEVSESVTTRETRTIDYTPVHDGNPLAAYADEGWTVRERIFTRTAIVVGDESPEERIVKPRGGDAMKNTLEPIDKDDPSTTKGGFGFSGGGAGTDVDEGWNTIQSTSQVTQQWIGDPEFGQIQVSIVSENVIKRYHERPTA